MNQKPNDTGGGLGIFFITFVVTVILMFFMFYLLSAVLSYSWNNVMPQVFGFSQITIWQAFVLLIVVRILLPHNITLPNTDKYNLKF